MYYLIKDLPEDERPRERLLKHGVSALSTVELLALLLKTGNKGMSAIELAKKVLYKLKESNNIATITTEELMTVDGIGIAKASTIVAALELFKRLLSEKKQRPKSLITPSDVYYIMADEIEDLENEHFYCLYLDIRHNLVSKKRLFIGGLTTSIINPRDIFKYAVRINAAKVIFVHNHPTGSPYPSPQDKLTTGKLVEGGKLLGIIVVDHVIIGKNNCFSILEDKIYEF